MMLFVSTDLEGDRGIQVLKNHFTIDLNNQYYSWKTKIIFKIISLVLSLYAIWFLCANGFIVSKLLLFIIVFLHVFTAIKEFQFLYNDISELVNITRKLDCLSYKSLNEFLELFGSRSRTAILLILGIKMNGKDTPYFDFKINKRGDLFISKDLVWRVKFKMTEFDVSFAVPLPDSDIAKNKESGFYFLDYSNEGLRLVICGLDKIKEYFSIVNISLDTRKAYFKEIKNSYRDTVYDHYKYDLIEALKLEGVQNELI